MAVLTVRSLPDQTKAALRVKAAKLGVSLESYVRQILQKASNEDLFSSPKVMEIAAEYFGESNGEDLDLPSRKSLRETVEFKK